MRGTGILKSHSLAWRLGRAVALARQRGTTSTVAEDIIQVFGEVAAGKVFEGKIVGVGQRLYKGHSYGEVVVEKLRDYERDSNDVVESDNATITPERVRIPFKNENLIVEAEYAGGDRAVRFVSKILSPASIHYLLNNVLYQILATVPDLIMVLDSLTGEAVGVPEYRFVFTFPHNSPFILYATLQSDKSAKTDTAATASKSWSSSRPRIRSGPARRGRSRSADRGRSGTIWITSRLGGTRSRGA